MTHDEWQPIETAPKDGDSFLAVDSTGEILICFYGEDVNGEEGFFSMSWVNGMDLLPVNLTHWLPLPKPPKGDK